jgi:hypothetical protein
MNDLLKELDSIQLDVTIDYQRATNYYDINLKNFYISNLYKAADYFNEYNTVDFLVKTTDWNKFLTDKFTSYDYPVDDYTCKDITDRHYVKDTYYELAKTVYKYRNIAEQNKIAIQKWLIDHCRYRHKPFYMMYIVGAFVEHRNSNKEYFMQNINAFKKINWIELEQ